MADTIKFGSNNIDKIYFGSLEVDALYKGSTKLYEKTASIYTITPTLIDITADSSNPSTIEKGKTVTLIYYAKSSYKLPANIVVSNATIDSWDSSTGILIISNPVGNVTIIISGEATEAIELCFTANTAGSTIELIKNGSPSISGTAYSFDRQTWTTFTPSKTSGTNTITLTNVGDKVYFRNNINYEFSSSNFMRFVMSGSIAASGNCNSIHTATGFNSLTTLAYPYCYYKLFWYCSSLTSAPALPATALTKLCYYGMFYCCSNLTIAPVLPATTLATNCYASMFYCCTSLASAPILPATAIGPGYCYNSMFAYCTSLTTAPSLPSANSSEYCYQGMFYGCTSLTTVPILHANRLTSAFYMDMFKGCTSLYVSDTQTTEASHAWGIPASGTFTNTTTYNQTNMFYGCNGTRSSDTMSGAYGESHTYYTQNEPV